MNIKESLAWSVKHLKKIDGAALDAGVLLCAALGKPKEFIYTHPEKKLTAAQFKKYKNFILRRAKHEPAAYILGKKEFYGFEFLVNKNVLIPRPDTETLITAVLSTVGSETPYSYPHRVALELSRATRCKQAIIDVGTGSGAIAVALKKLMPRAQVFASDISSASLALAKKNARRLGAGIIFKKGNLLEPFFNCSPSTPLRRVYPVLRYGTREIKMILPRACRGATLIITANLPYLSQAEWRKTQPEVKKYEPRGALVGGKTGAEIYEKLFEEINIFLHSRESGNLATNKKDSRFRGNEAVVQLFLEIGYNQKSAIEKLARKILNPQKIEFYKDLAGKWRVAKIIIKT